MLTVLPSLALTKLFQLCRYDCDDLFRLSRLAFVFTGLSTPLSNPSELLHSTSAVLSSRHAMEGGSRALVVRCLLALGDMVCSGPSSDHPERDTSHLCVRHKRSSHACLS
eukprot:TRINITY_DN10909_c0_g2_i1.p1 TRINITY_DN10909_c0_g2~~TRINITY_DN10909_c0_g2_i1.p1  ORF type:complete len:110 (+),score=0.12 TRINITY_DN10909_c0_g2_i1:313-642(+)